MVDAENNPHRAGPAHAGVLRRLAAMVYDLFPVLALAIVATMPFLPFLHGRRFIPAEVGWLAYLHWAVVLLVAGGFFVFFWTSRGQTVGMVTWRLRLENPDGSLIGKRQAIARVALAGLTWVPFFAGYPLIWGRWEDESQRKLATALSLLPVLLPYVWIWIDRERRALLDRWTATRVVVLPKRKKK